MFSRMTLAVDIGAGSIKMMFGNRSKVAAYQMVDTPKNTMEDNKIIKVDEIFNLIDGFIKKNKLRPTDISFAVYGQDLVIRHIEVPYMKEANVRQTVEWEIGQNLPESGANYYIDYEILNREEGKRTKTYKVLVAAVVKERIEKYLELAKMLKLNINAIDITSNCTARVFKQLSSGRNAIKNAGVIDIGHSNTGITIVEHGKIAIERQVPFGYEKLVKEVNKINPELTNKEYEYIHHKFNFNNTESEVDMKVNKLLDNVFSSFQKVIQFYTTGKIEKGIAQLYVVGVGSTINGIEEFIQSYLSSPTEIVKDPVSIGHKIKLPRGCELKFFINTLGLLLRED